MNETREEFCRDALAVAVHPWQCSIDALMDYGCTFLLEQWGLTSWLTQPLKAASTRSALHACATRPPVDAHVLIMLNLHVQLLPLQHTTTSEYHNVNYV